jgi:hypothetical protein
MVVIGLAAALGAGAFTAYRRHAALPDPGRVVVIHATSTTAEIKLLLPLLVLPLLLRCLVRYEETGQIPA